MGYKISIHALLAESDVAFKRFNLLGAIFLSTLSLRRATNFRCSIKCAICNFYPRSPCGERPILCVVSVQIGGFLSTLSLRRATRLPTALRTPHHRFLSTLSLRRATAPSPPRREFYKISIHALLAESDVLLSFIFSLPLVFLSTLSLRRATGF